MAVEQLPPLTSAIDVFRELGFFDVILPFLLISPEMSTQKDDWSNNLYTGNGHFFQ